MKIKENKEIDFIAIILLIWKRKYILLFFATVFVGFGYYKYKLIKGHYTVSSLLVAKTVSNAFLSQGFSSFTSSSDEFGNILSIASSSHILKQVFDSIPSLRTRCVQKVRFHDKEFYKNAPFTILWNPSDPQPVSISFKITVLKNGKFRIFIPPLQNIVLFDYVAQKRIYKRVAFQGMDKVFDHGQFVKTSFCNFQIIKTPHQDSNVSLEEPYFFSFLDDFSSFSNFGSSIEFKKHKNASSNILLEITTDNIQKSVVFINALVVFVRKYELQNKNVTSKYSIDYINKQIGSVLDSLVIFENKEILYHKKNRITNVDSNINEILYKLRQIDTKRIELKRKESYITYIKSYALAKIGKKSLMAPSLFGIDDAQIIALYKSLDDLNFMMIEMGFSDNELTTPFRYELEGRIEQHKKKFLHGISERYKTNQIWLKQLKEEENRLKIEMEKLPIYQRDLLKINRYRQLLESRYNRLLEKKEELQIIQANNLPDTRVLDPARDMGQSLIFPDFKKHMLIHLAVGLGLGLFVILLINFIKHIRTQLKNA